MKQGLGLSFGITAVVAGQKSSTVNAEPQLIVNSTSGKFTITAPVSKALGIAVGENIMFLNNIKGVEDAIDNKVADLVAWADENVIDLDTKEGKDVALKTFSQWFIAKGVSLYKSNGQPIMATERFTKEDKEAFLAEHRTEMMEANRAELIARIGNADATDEELEAAITIEDVESPTFHAVSGSKTASTSSATGVGLQLSFTDTAIWNQIKSDMEDKTALKRVFSVDVEDVQDAPFSNGKETITVKAFPLTFVADEKAVIRAKKAGDAESDNEAEDAE